MNVVFEVDILDYLEKLKDIQIYSDIDVSMYFHCVCAEIHKKFDIPIMKNVAEENKFR